MRLPTGLTVLESCETFKGELKSGEGIINLASAFTYAGSRSIIATAWEMEQSSSRITDHFYALLKAGHPKDIALQRAKQTYRQQTSGGIAHPQFWAVQMLIGDVSPLNESNRLWIWGLAIVLLGGLVVFWGPIFQWTRKIFS